MTAVNYNPTDYQTIEHGFKKAVGEDKDGIGSVVEESAEEVITDIVSVPLVFTELVIEPEIIEAVEIFKKIVKTVGSMITEDDIDNIISFIEKIFQKIIHIANQSNIQLNHDTPIIKRFIYNILSILYSPSFTANSLLFNSVYERITIMLSSIPNLETNELKNLMELYKKAIENGSINDETKKIFDAKLINELNTAFNKYEKKVKTNLTMAPVSDIVGFQTDSKKGGKKIKKNNFKKFKSVIQPVSNVSKRYKYIKKIKKSIKKTLYKYHRLQIKSNKNKYKNKNKTKKRR